MSSYLTARLGLQNLAGEDGEALGVADWNQLARLSGATRAWLVDRLGGPGLYGGGAANLADLPGGTAYPPCHLALRDDSGQLWCVSIEAAQLIDFQLSDGSSVGLYAVPALQPDVQPAAAVGGLASVRFVADVTTPAHGLRLGSGEAVGGAFVSYSPDTTVTPGPARLPGLALTQRLTPTGSADAVGTVGQLAWDDGYLYLKTTTGWRRAALQSW